MSTGGTLVIAALAAAAVDWAAVVRGSKRVEYVCKPLTLALLVAAALAFRSNAPAGRWAFTVTALVLSLAGDVFLMLPKDLFVAGLASFMLAHLAYVVAFNLTPPPLGLTVVAAAVVLAAGFAIYLPIRRGAASRGHPELAAPLAAYLLAIAAMVVSAVATHGRAGWTAGASDLAISGALLFFVSDSLIGWTRFVRDLRWGPLAIIVTYHLGQVALTLGLVGNVGPLSVVR